MKHPKVFILILTILFVILFFYAFEYIQSNRLLKYQVYKTECAKEMKCYDPYKGTCVFCFNLQSCENMYGCGDMKPIDPTTNYCSKCWPVITY